MVAVDAESEESEQWTSKPGAGDDDQEMVQCEYDGDESACRVLPDGILLAVHQGWGTDDGRDP